MAVHADSTGGLFASLKGLWRTFLAILLNRLELLLVEFEEGRRQAVQVVLLVLVVGTLALMTLMVGTFTLVVIFWEDRVKVLVALSLAYLLGTAAAYWRLRRAVKNWPAFSATLGELKKDKAWLEGMK